MAFSIYDTNVLIQVVPNLKLASTFLLDKFFGSTILSDTKFVSIDVDVGIRRMSPLVSPLIEGKLVESRSFRTDTFTPAYIKDRRALDVTKPVRRAIGERIGGDGSPQEREMQNLESELTDQIDMLNRRMEYFAAETLLTGRLTIAGEGYPTQVIDFGRAASLSPAAYTGAALWDDPASTADPAGELENFATVVLKESGAQVTDIVMTPTPYAMFIKSQRVRDAVYFPRSGDSQLDFGATKTIKGAAFKGIWGSYRLWISNDWFVDDSNVQQRMIPDGAIIMCGEDMMGVRAYASIIDPAFNYASMAYAPKSWVEQDPAQRMLLMQSSPIVIPSRVNACLAATVTSARSV